MNEITEKNDTMVPLYEAIIKHIPPPPKSDVSYFQFLVSNLDYSDYLGRIAYGRIVSGRISVGEHRRAHRPQWHPRAGEHHRHSYPPGPGQGGNQARQRRRHHRHLWF
ncbi:MAG: hypothetical protein QM796_04840 [Chthoniobacteraceae bacterium]